MHQWASGKCFQELNYGNYIGTFIKDILRLDNLVQTIENILIIMEKNELSIKFKKIHSLIIRDIVSTESLYIL